MNQHRKNTAAGGFTLIELIIVVAILAFVAMVGLRGYANLRETQARKVNAANLKRIAHSLATYETIHLENGTSGFFKNFDSLIDVTASGAWYGTQGSIDWGTVAGGSVDEGVEILEETGGAVFKVEGLVGGEGVRDAFEVGDVDLAGLVFADVGVAAEADHGDEGQDGDDDDQLDEREAGGGVAGGGGLLVVLHGRVL